MSIRMKAAIAVLCAQAETKQSIGKVIEFIKSGDSSDKTAIQMLDNDLVDTIDSIQNLRKALKDPENCTNNDDATQSATANASNFSNGVTGEAGDNLFFRLPDGDHASQLWILVDPDDKSAMARVRSCTTGLIRQHARLQLITAQELTPNDPVEYLSDDGEVGFLATVIRQEQDSNKVIVKINYPDAHSVYRVEQQVEVSEDSLTFYDRWGYDRRNV